MAKYASASASKNGNGGYNDKNISPGGQIYDRTTGTWVGDSGPSYTGDGVGRPAMVIHDANGPVGIKLAPVKRHDSPSLPAGPGAGLTSNGLNGGSASVGASVSGPAAPLVATSPGAKGAGKKFAPLGGFPALTTKVKTENTSIVIGGVYIEAPPGFSNVDQWEELLGEPGEFLGAPFVIGGLIGHNLRRAVDHWGPVYAEHIANQPAPAYAGKGNHFLQSAQDWWSQANSPWGPDKPTPGFVSGGF